MTKSQEIRVGSYIGGTFTDIALDLRGHMDSTKELINHAAPEQAILDGISIVTEQASIAPSEIDIIIYSTTLATNALIDRLGTRTALPHSDWSRE